MLGGMTGESWWKSNTTPLSKAVRAGLICEARSCPKLATCTSPQWYTWATKKEATIPKGFRRGTWSGRSSWAWTITGRMSLPYRAKACS